MALANIKTCVIQRSRANPVVARKKPIRTIPKLIRLAVTVAAAALSACANVSVKPLTAGNEEFRTTPAEIKLLERASMAHQELASKGLLLEDRAVLAYVRQVGDQLIPQGVSSRLPIRFHVLRSPVPNAMALAGGDIYITVGYLAKLDNSDQLAFVLAHEVAHVIRRHAHAAHLEERAGWIGAKVADILLLGTGLSYFPYVASLAAYSREREQEADEDAVIAISSAGYAAHEALTALDRSVESKHGRSDSDWRTSHPSIDERITRLTAKLEKTPAGSIQKVGADIPPSIKTSVVLETIRLNLRARRYAIAGEFANRLLSDTAFRALAHYYAGESKRLSADDPTGAAKESAWLNSSRFEPKLVEDFQARRRDALLQAIASFEAAQKADPSLSIAGKGLGLSYVALGEPGRGIQLLKAFLSLHPTDPENLYLKRIISKGEL